MDTRQKLGLIRSEVNWATESRKVNSGLAGARLFVKQVIAACFYIYCPGCGLGCSSQATPCSRHIGFRS